MNDPSSQADSTGGKELPPGTRLEEFVIERVLGSGGFGITYLATDLSLNRQVVIKENLPSQFAHRDTTSLTVHAGPGREDQENFRWSLENFSREGETLASLRHPGIVPVLRRFEAFGTAYFVMPFVEGVTLDVLMRERQEADQPFTEAELRGMLERVLDALGYLHERGIYHRDIKPGNILITTDGLPVLIDFGSARQRLSERSMTVIESAGYTPFEQLQTRGKVGPWSDLYALGGTVVKVITGETPPKAMDRMRNDPFLPLTERVELASKFSKAFLRSFDQALAVDEGERWQEAREWLASLRAEVAMEMTSLPPKMERRTDSAEIPVKKVNRQPWIIAAAVVFGLFALAKMSSQRDTAPDLVNKRAIQSDRENAQAADERARVAEQRTLQLEQEKQSLAKMAEEKEALAAKQQAGLNRAARERAEAEKLVEPTAERAPSSPRPGEERDFEIAPGVKMTMCWIPPGEFVMGSPAGEPGRSEDEGQHQVKLSNGFWLAKTESTQAQWRAVMGNNPSRFKGDDLPVETVSWNDVAGPGGFIEKANQADATGGDRFSLPTETQWEYACRAGSTGSYAGVLDQMAWYGENAGMKTHPVGGKKANVWGLHDMHGNVSEWCAGGYVDYPRGEVTDPQGGASGSYRVGRGGSWSDGAVNCRVADRDYYGNPAYTINGVGFRVARSSVP